MKKLVLLLTLTVLSMGCASGIKTRKISFECDPKVNEGRDVLVNVVIFDNAKDAEALSQDIEKAGPSAWFGGQGHPRHEQYEKANKQVFDLRPQTEKQKPQLETLDKSKLKKAKALLIVAENGRNRSSGSRSVIFLNKETSSPKPRETEYVHIGPNHIKRMGKTWWFFGWHGSLEEL